VTFDLDDLVRCLDLEPVGEAVFSGDNLSLDYHRVFGGQILAQTIRALQAAAPPGKALKSFVQRFPREGDVASPMTYAVTKVQDGRTFASFDVLATQADKVVSTCSASLHVPEQGWERQDATPASHGPEAATPTELGMIPWEVRVVDGTDLGNRSIGPARFQFWMRAPAGAEPALLDTTWGHQALLAHATDLTLIGTALLPLEGLSQDDTGVRFHSAVTTHAMWFHAPVRIDDWLFVDQTSPTMSGGRAFGRGDVWSAAGALVASFAQEAMVRPLS
jgi:acyl-CoA thioesterase II